MPQPATHYLVTRRAIPKEHWSSWWDNYKPYFGLGSSAPDLFYFPLLPQIIKNIRADISWEAIANPMHSERSYDMFCTLLSIAKNNKQDGHTGAEKQFAFAFGYYCHVVTDCIFHPYVYRSTGDYWCTTEFDNELYHKMQEFFIDTGIFHKFYDKSQNFSKIQWQCMDDAGELLEYPIALLFHQALQEVYPDCYPASPDVMNKDHPIQQAYSATVQSIPSLFEGNKIYLWGKRLIVNVREIIPEIQDNFFTSPYPDCSTLDSYTPEELFNFSSVACRKIFRIALGFWESEALPAKKYFQSHLAHYLNAGNWNLDTGFPSQYNNYTNMRNTDPEHYSFKADELKHNYTTLQLEYDPTDFL